MPAKPKPSPLAVRCKQIIKLTDWFCESHLNEEYHDMCRVMARHFCVKGAPALKGKASGWAAAIVAAVGYANFLHDPDQQPHVSKRDLAKAFGVTQAELKKHTDQLISGFDLIPFDPDFSLPSRMNLHSMVWEEATKRCIQYDELPSELQREALKVVLAAEKIAIARGDVVPASMECEGSEPCVSEECCQGSVAETKKSQKRSTGRRPRF
jgi:hypothetical protein